MTHAMASLIMAMAAAQVRQMAALSELKEVSYDVREGLRKSQDDIVAAMKEVAEEG